MTVTLAPRRPHTLPSSRPMTPPPITPRRSGTASNSNAPQESTMVLPSKGTMGSSIGTEPAANTTCSHSSTRGSPSGGVNSTRPGASIFP